MGDEPNWAALSTDQPEQRPSTATNNCSATITFRPVPNPGQETCRSNFPKNVFSQDRRIKNKCINTENSIAHFPACEAQKTNSEIGGHPQSTAANSKSSHQSIQLYQKHRESCTADRWAWAPKEGGAKTSHQTPQPQPVSVPLTLTYTLWVQK